MKKITITLYEFDELSEKVKQKVIRNYRAYSDYYFIDDDIEVIKGFAKDFNVVINDYELSPYSYSYFKYDFDDDFDINTLDITKLNDDDLLYDEMLETFKQHYKETDNYQYAFHKAIERATKYILDEMEYQDSDEYIRDHFVSNEWFFTEDGERH